MNILYHHRIGSKDGQFVHVQELTRALRRLGHRIIMVGPSAVGHGKFGADSASINTLKKWMPRFAYESLEFLYGVSAYRRLLRIALRESPDGIYERYNLFLPAGVWTKRRLGIPMLLEVNAPLFEERSRYGQGISLSRLALWSERTAWRGADYVLPVTDVLADHVRRAGVPAARTVVIPNGVNREAFLDLPGAADAKRVLGLEGRLVLGFVGFLREWHGLESAVDCLDGNFGPAEPHLLVVGDGPARERIEARARTAGVAERVTFTGIVDRPRIPSYIAAFDIALQPAVVPYASPLKLFEYLALGRAIVAPRTPNILEILTHEQDSLLFEPSDLDAFAGAIRRLLQDQELRVRLGRNARELVDRRGLTWERNAEKVADLFRSLGVRDEADRPRGSPARGTGA